MQVALKTVLADFSTKEVIRMIGCKAERATMQQGPQGKIQGKFADGSLETLVYNNKVLDAKPILKRPACKRPAAAVSKKPAAACPVPAPAAADEETEEELSEEDEGEDLEEGEEEEEAEEEETEEEVPPIRPPLPAAPAIPEDCSDCNRNINKNNKKNILTLSQNNHEIVRNSMQEMMECYKSKTYFAVYFKQNFMGIRRRLFK